MKIAFDIETIPEGNPEDIEVRAPANYKKPEAIEKYIEEHRDEEFRKGALKGISGQIVSIAWNYLDGPGDGPLIMSEARSKGESEADLLYAFYQSIRVYKESDASSTNLWIGHNILDFDLRFLYQRSLVCGVMPTVMLPVDARHGQGVFDTMKAWGGWKGYVKQDELYKALGGPELEDDDIDGSMVYDLWLADEIDTIRDYNERDVMKVIRNYRRLKWGQ